MTQRTSAEGGGLSAQTLIIAAISSGMAAVVVSQVWEQGTVFSAALTPVIVALVSEFLKRPTEHVSRRVASRRTAPREGERRRVPLPSEPDYEPPVPGRKERELPPGVSVYGASRKPRPIHVGVALVTGLIAFAIAATVLTVPELLFGKSVDGKRDTTFFGGGNRDRQEEETPTITVPEETQPAPEAETAPQEEPPPTTTTTPPPTQTQPPSQQPPSTQQPPGGGAPAPQQAPPANP